MSTIIKDGKTGQTAVVDDHGRLYTRANVVSHMSHHATYHTNAFVKDYTTTLAGTSETVCALLQNNISTRDLEIYWVKVSSDANVEVIISKNGTYLSGGVTCEPENTNFNASGDSANISYEGGASADLVLTTSDEVDIDGFFLGSYVLSDGDYVGGLVLPFKKSLAIKVKGAVSNKVRITIGYAMHNEGAKL